MRGALDVGDVLGDGADVLDAARRATMLDDLNAAWPADARAAPTPWTSALHDHQAVLKREIRSAQSALDEMDAQSRAAQHSLAAAGRAEDDLRAQLAAQKRLRELNSILLAGRAPSPRGRRRPGPE